MYRSSKSACANMQVRVRPCVVFQRILGFAFVRQKQTLYCCHVVNSGPSGGQGEGDRPPMILADMLLLFFVLLTEVTHY